jgi:hypothetical protein
MSSNPQNAVLPLKAVAAGAAKLADDVERGRLWDGEFNQALAVIQRALEDAARAR